MVRWLSRSDFARLRVEAAIECSPEAPSDLKAHRLVTEEILAVVTPEHYEEVTASGAVFNKLYMPSRPELWGKWLEGYGAPVGQAGLRFENRSDERRVGKECVS